MPKQQQLQPQHLRDLLVDPLHHPRGQGHLSAASGLVRVQRRLYVVADDEHHLGVLSTTGQAPVRLVRLFQRDLPESMKARKKAKADLETLVHVPAMPGHPFGALVALGSGSDPHRRASARRSRAVVIPLDASGAVIERMHMTDLSPLYQRLRKSLGGLNIEGAFAADGQMCLLQRAKKGGKKGDSPNACVRYDWKTFMTWLLGKRNERPPILSITEIDVGEVDGVPLGLTDGVALAAGRWAFSAVAENTGSSFDDGPCIASVVGVMSSDGTVLQSYRLKDAPKVEGISAVVRGSEISLTMVTDDDNPAAPSRLLRVSW
jgi:hypothetical protein